MSHHGVDTRQGTEKDPEGEEERMENWRKWKPLPVPGAALNESTQLASLGPPGSHSLAFPEHLVHSWHSAKHQGYRDGGEQKQGARYLDRWPGSHMSNVLCSASSGGDSMHLPC